MLKSFSPGSKMGSSRMQRTCSTRAVNGRFPGNMKYVGNNYNAEVGYVPRKNYIRLNPKIAELFFPKTGGVLSHGPVIGANYYFDRKFHHTDDESLR